MSHDIYNYPRRLSNLLNNIKKSKIRKKNKKLLLEFYESCMAEGLSLSRIIRCLYTMKAFSYWVEKDFDKCNKKDIVKILAELEKGTHAHNTKQEMKATLRKFFKWLRDTEEYPKEVKWIKCRRKLNNKKLPEDMLNDEDIKLLISSTSKPRDKALISVLYESGCRIGEVLSLRIKHVTYDQYGSILLVNGKTGMRRIRVVTSSQYLKDWINKHPYNNDSESPLWVLDKNHKEIKHNDIQRILRGIKKKSGITKKINPHNFRHSRATFLANHLSGSQLREFFGWTQSSNMAIVYIHMSGKNVDDSLLKNVYGLNIKNNVNETKFKAITCLKCGEENVPTNTFCKICRTILDKSEIINIIERDFQRRKSDEIMDKLIQDPEFKNMLLSKIKQIV